MASLPSTTAGPGAGFVHLPSLDNTMGAYMLGTFIGLILYGVCLMQLYRYVRLYPTDTLYIRTLVILVMILETLDVVLPMHTLYYYLVTNYASAEAIQKLVWSLDLGMLIGSVISLASQIFFVRRVSLIGFRYQIVAGIAVFCLLAAIGFSIAVSIRLFQSTSIAQFFSSDRNWMIGTPFVFGAVADHLLSGAILVALRRSDRERTRTGTWVESSILYIVDAGTLTSLIHTSCAVLALVSPDNLIWCGVGVIFIRTYAITLLSVLNSRKFTHARGVYIFDSPSLGRNAIARATRMAAAERWAAPQLPDETPPVIKVNVEAEIEGEETHDMTDMQKYVPTRNVTTRI
ncbi:hypothetical protein OH77DRAFT_1592355 [Trametes cingulata]|nr:hypothetical protein OH77DRAFT_1592355 [Trametes cingulata]